jgi:type VI secretion system protein ImpL
MLSFLKRRIVLVSLGLALIIWCVWMIDPLSNVIDPPLSQYVAVGIVLAWYGGYLLWKRLRAQRAGDQLAAAVVKQSAGERPSADVVQLRERFEEAVAALKQSKKRGGRSLYELPWYVIIGAPGSGKTTALVNSGLHFPLEQRSGKGALRGVGGTRNCDWWFTDEAVFLDTAGRYTTQDSDATADSAGWAEFLALLKKYRKRRPINGVLLAISAHDLMVQGQAGREAHVAAARRRLNELNKELKIQLPVYVLVTKCDLVSGFTEYFDDVAQEGRTQVWGVTFPQDMTQSGKAAGAYADEFDALMARLNERVLARLEDDRDVRRRARVFGFPQQMAALRDSLSEFITDVFEATRFDQRVHLRGVYFTSGTQEGTPIDRLLGALGRRFSVPPEAVVPMGRGKAYFIERLLKEVVLAESGLAGVNRRHEVRKAALQMGAYAGLVLAAVLGVILLSWLYNRNVAYIETVGAEARRLERVGGAASGASPDVVLNRLDAVHTLVETADARSEVVPWGTGWLFAGSQLGSAARQAYAREVDEALLDRLVSLFRQRMSDVTAAPVTQYRFLKGYLMLKHQEHLDTGYLGGLAALEWRSAYGENAAIGDRLALHFRQLLEYQPGGFRAPTLEAEDDQLVARVRARLQDAPLEELAYGEIQTRHQDPAGAQPLDALNDKVFLRKSGGRFSQPMSSLYTKPTFQRVVSDEVKQLQRQLRDDYQWVIGGERVLPTFPADLDRRVIQVYEKDYIRAWDTVLADVGIVRPKGVAATKEALRVVAGKNSLLRRLLVIVDTHTFLVESVAPAKPEGFLDTWSARAAGWFNAFQGALKGQSQTPGALVTEYFLPIHALLAGEPGKTPLDELLAELEKMGQQLEKIGSGVGQSQANENDLRDLGQSSEALQRDGAALPGSARAVGDIAAEIGKSAADATRGSAGAALAEAYVRNVLERCTPVVRGRYPFVAYSPGVPEVPIQDFVDLFGAGGVFDAFFTSNLEKLVDTNRRPWAWRAGAPAGVPLSAFENAQRIRDMFFGRGSRTVQVNFKVGFLALTPSDKLSRFVLEIDGMNPPLAYRFEPLRMMDVEWPGQKPGPAVATFEERGGRKIPITADGAWAWFKLLEQGELKQDGAPERFHLAFARQGHRVEIRLEAASVNNPFGPAARRTLQGFSCGG